ncbi:glycoside hydrolase family 3 protein [Fusicatenibacter saccharivorans]|uniref:glycoside hydrolase family 3 protein n=1 Tax=Fusicatenibacter saccharivorans TaxID=1150298 RepID=UPI0032C179DC
MKAKVRTFNGTTSPEVTQRETDHRKLAREAAAEGFVLLENKDHFLPLAKGSKVGLYGAGAIRTIKGGTGSGDVNERDSVNIFQGMKNAGYDVTSSEWLEDYDKLYVQARLDWKNEIFTKLNGDDTKFFDAYSATPFFMPSGNPIDEEKAAADGADTAFFVLARIAGENKDRFDTEGDYFISKEEKAILAQVSRCYKNIVLVINTGGLMDLAFVEEFDNIRSILQYVQAGQEGGNAFADVVSGDVTPSGKMTDTWAKDYYDYPGAEVYSYKSGDLMKEKYEEGIFVGYRYFDTFEVPVRYSFGYGMSYTDFEIRTDDIKVSGRGMMNPKVSVTVTVTNTGDTYAGKEVVQIYASCPQGRLVKEFRRLAGFGKTKLLAPKESQTMTITFPLYQLTSYEEESASWILEPGMYGIWVGNDLNTSVLSGALELDEKAVMTACENICPLKEELNEIAPDAEKVQAREAAWQKEVKEKRMSVIELKAAEIPTEKVDYQPVPEELPGKAGKIVDSLSVDQLAFLATGDPGRAQGNALGSAGISVPGAAAETSPCASEEPWNVTTIALVDGPAGLRLKREYQVDNGEIVASDFLAALEGGFFSKPQEKRGTTYYQFCTAIPVGTLLAQSWDVELIKRVGEMIGHEMELFNVTLWLAPGMNIHRNPLCGRNFEYYSEDPLLAGMMAAAMTLGVQKVPGCGTTIKHFACNNQEDNRMGSDSILSERALREIYLKGFEIAVKDAQPMSIMTSYNLINGVHAANCYDTCTKAARDEWGFAGAIMTDWTTTNVQIQGECTAAGCMRAGNDMVMPGLPEDHENIKKELADGTLTMAELKRCIYNTVNIVLQSNMYEGAVSYLDQFDDLDTYLVVK